MAVAFEDKSVTGPGCHAFIVGVDGYPHVKESSTAGLGFLQLTFAVRSAVRVYQWLRHARLRVPLASVRLLLSPGEGDAPQETAELPTLENFIRDASQWRRAAATHRESLTFFYFAGHGFATSASEQVLLLRDFGDGIGPLLRNAVSLNNIFSGMSPDWSGDIARTQLYFVDSGRSRIDALSRLQSQNATAVFDARLQGIDDRIAPIFYASSFGGEAFGISNDTTLFCRALIEGLDGAAAESLDDGAWAVTVLSLAGYLRARVDQLNTEFGASQTIGVGGLVEQAAISYLPGPPPVDLSLRIDLADDARLTAVRILNEDSNVSAEWAAPVNTDLQVTVPAGIYQAEVTGEVSGKRVVRRRAVMAGPRGARIAVKLP
jgi:hypothetical protein